PGMTPDPLESSVGKLIGALALRGPLLAGLCAACLVPTACSSDSPAEQGTSSDAGSDADAGEQIDVPPVADLISAVNPFIGSGGVGFWVGSAYPGPALPFAMIHPGPDTNTKALDGLGFYHCAGYHYGDPLLEAFSLTHAHGTGVADYGTLGLMPLIATPGQALDASLRSEAGYASPYSDEIASLGYYSVVLDGGIRVEITATQRAALFRFEFPETGEPVVLLHTEHTVGDGKSGGGDVSLSGSAFSARMHNLGDLSGRYGGFEVF